MKNSRTFSTVSLWIAVVLGLALHLSPPAHAVGEADPASVYLQGYMSFQDAAKILEDGNVEEAQQKLLQSRDLLLAVSRTHPDWNPQMLSYRLSKVNEMLQKVETQLAASRPTPPPAATPGTLPLPGTNPAPAVPNPNPPLVGNPNSLTDEIERRFRQNAIDISVLRDQNAKLQQQLEVGRGRYQEAIDEIAAWKRREESARAAVADVERELQAAKESGASRAIELEQELAIMRNNLETATDGLSGANGRTSELMAELETARSQIAALQRERDEAIKERDQSRAIVQSYEDGADEGMRTLLAENKRLQEQLRDALSDVENLTNDQTSKAAQIAQLEEQVGAVREQLAMMKEENASYQDNIASLTSRLRETEKLVAGATPEELAPALVAENTVLRRVIIRQLSRQARMKWTQELIEAELIKQESSSSELIRHFAALTDQDILVGEEEQHLFREPVIGDLGGGSDGAIVFDLSNSGSGAPPTPPPAELTGKDLLREAGKLVTDGDLATAEAYYETYLEDGSDDRRVYANLGIIRLRMGDYEGADQALRQALMAAPDNPRSHYLLGVNNCWQGKDNDAFDALQSATKLDPENPYAQHYLGVVAARMGDIEIAHGAFSRAVELDPTYAASHFNLAVIHATADQPRPNEAKRHYDLAIENGEERDETMETLLQRIASGELGA